MILFDIDGTLIKKYDEIYYDTWSINPGVIMFLQQIAGQYIYFLTKRHEEYRKETEKMISDIFFQYSIDADYTIIMRTCNGTDSSGNIKWDLFQKRGIKPSKCVLIDDSKSVKEVFEANGVSVIHPDTIHKLFL